MLTLNEAINRLDNPVIEVTRSVFRDRHGNWAKAFEDVRDIVVDFSDDTQAMLTPAQFRALTRAQQTKVRNAPSSPLP